MGHRRGQVRLEAHLGLTLPTIIKFGGTRARQSNLVVHDLAVGLYQRFSIKWCFPKEQLIGTDSQ